MSHGRRIAQIALAKAHVNFLVVVDSVGATIFRIVGSALYAHPLGRGIEVCKKFLEIREYFPQFLTHRLL